MHTFSSGYYSVSSTLQHADTSSSRSQTDVQPYNVLINLELHHYRSGNRIVYCGELVIKLQFDSELRISIIIISSIRINSDVSL